MSYIRIFDEFQQPASEVTAGLRHQKRVKLEPLIFDILKRNYGARMEDFWNKHVKIPLAQDTDRAIVIVERRIHENLWFLLRNAAYFARGWAIIVVCSDTNMPYLQSIAEPHTQSIRWLPYFQGSPDRDSARSQYNLIFKDPEFYASLPCEHLLFLQTDSYLRKHVPNSFLDYDFIGAPFAWDDQNAGGGTTFRRKSAMIDICSRFGEPIESEDLYASTGAKALGYKVPPFETGITYIVESCHYEDPIAVHQWWTFFFHDSEDVEIICSSLLQLDLAE